MTEDTFASSESVDSSDQVETTHEDVSQEVEAAQAAPKKYRVKGDGFDEEIDEATLIKGYQLERTGSRRFEEASKLYKNVQPYIPIIEALKNGDLDVLKQLGVPQEALRRFSEKELLAYIEEQEMSPEQRELQATKRERDSLAAERDENHKRTAAQQREAASQQAVQELDTDMRSALESANVPLKGNYLLVRRIAEDMYASIEAGKTPSAKESLARVQQGLSKDYSEHAMREFTRDSDAFIRSLPPKILDGIRKASLKEVRNQLPIGNRVATVNKAPRKDPTFDDYMKEEMRRRV